MCLLVNQAILLNMHFFWVSLQLTKKMLHKGQHPQINMIQNCTEWPNPRSMLWMPYMTLAAQSCLSIPPHVWKAFCGKHLRWQLLSELTKKHQTYLFSVSKCHSLARFSPEDIFILTICTCHPLSTDWEAWTLSVQLPHAVLAWGNPAHSW